MLSRKKAQIAKRSVEWCGYRLCEDGYTVTSGLVAQLIPGATQQNGRQVFLWAGAAVGGTSPNITDNIAPVHAPLSPSSAFIWTADQEKAFRDIINELTCPRILSSFRPGARLLS